MISRLMSQPCLHAKPPVLVDIGASGDIHKIWKPIAKYCICIAFDPDDRDINVTKSSGKGFKDFYLINKIVSNESIETDFYLTQSAHCSSTLSPNLEALKPYIGYSLFKTNKKIQQHTVTINDSLKMVGINYIDWLKTDTQGTDLRIFSSIQATILEKILVAELEPNILDAYHGEDKLYTVMEFFNKLNFWCDECVIRGLQRLNEKIADLHFNNFLKRIMLRASLKYSADWAELSYMNTLASANFEKRDLMLMCVFGLLKKQYGFVMEVANKGSKLFSENIFDDVEKYALKKIIINGYKNFPSRCYKQLIKKLKR